MQSTRYLPGYSYPIDHNLQDNAKSWSKPHDNMTWNSSRGFNILLPQFMVNQDSVHHKEILRQTILDHEATFRYQVNELHRIYGRQRELMYEIKRGKLAEDRLRLQSLDPNASMTCSRPGISEKTHWHIANLTSIELSTPRGDHFSGQNISEERNLCSLKSNSSRKRMLDLELPAEEYRRYEEGLPFVQENPVKKPNATITELQPPCYSKVNFVSARDPSTSLPSCRATSFMFDLNEPAHPVESFDEDSSVGRELLQCNKEASLPTETSEKDHAEKSMMVSSWRKYKESPIAVQALPCFTTEASFCKGSMSSPRNSSLNIKKSNMNQGSMGSPSDSTCEDLAAVEDDKVLGYASSGKCMDLNLTPPTYLSDDQSEGRHVEINPNSEVPDGSALPDSTPESRKCSSDNQLVGPTNICIDLNSGNEEEFLSSSPSEGAKSNAERDLRGPVSPENKEGSPPRGDSQDIKISTSGGHTDPIEELDRVAADTLIFISGNCLNWLAEVAAASLTSNPQNEVEVNMDYRRSHFKVGLSCNRRSRTKDRKDIQIAEVDSLLHQVNETDNTPKTGPLKKIVSRTSSKGRRRSKNGEKIVCSVLLQPNKHGITDRFLKGWGLTKKRQTARTARSCISPLFKHTLDS